MRTIIGTVLAAALGSGAMLATPTTDAVAQTRETLKVETWTATSPGLQDWWPPLVKAFEAQHPGVTVDVQNVSFTGYIPTLTTQFMAGSPPDIVHIPLPTINLAAWAEAGFLVPLDDRLAATDIPKLWPKTQAAMQWNGKTYGVLLTDYGFVMFYNEALLKAASVAVPTTPEQLLSAAAAVSGNGKYGFAITEDSSDNFVRDAFEFETGMGGQWAKDGKWNWTDPKVVAAMDLWRKLGRDYSPKGMDINAKRQAFYDGNVAMMIENPTVWPNVKTAARPELLPSLHLARVPFPVVPGDTSHGLAIPTGLDAARTALVWDFIQLAASPQWMSEYCRMVDAPVARPGALDSLRSNPDTAVIADSEANATLLVSNDDDGVRSHYADFSTAVGDALRELLQSDTPTATVLAKLEKTLTDKGISP